MSSTSTITAPKFLSEWYGDSPKDPFDLDSKETRSYYRQCQKCWKRKADGVKLSVCSSCKITAYCSSECQKADWQFHKDACKSNKAYRALMAKQDALERLENQLMGRPTSRPSSTAVNQEMSEFLRRFRPAICQASYRCFGVQEGNVNAWKENVFVVRIERIPNLPTDTKPWARYKVIDAKAAPLDKLRRDFGDALDSTLKQGETYHEENVRVGCTGTIMTFLECDSAGHDIRFVSWAGYGPEAWDDDEPCPDWRRAFIDTVDKATGRLSK